jgi:hypothetical protein
MIFSQNANNLNIVEYITISVMLCRPPKYAAASF